MYGAIFGSSHMIILSIFPISYPSCSMNSYVCCKRTIEEIPLYLGSVSGKCFPISPKPIAPMILSIIACNKTSASLCPFNPNSNGISTPPRINLRPSTNWWISIDCPILIMFITFLTYSSTNSLNIQKQTYLPITIYGNWLIFLLLSSTRIKLTLFWFYYIWSYFLILT